MEEMSKNEYMHVPYAVILYKYLQQWKATHEGKPPKNYDEKRDFKTLIKSSKIHFSLPLKNIREKVCFSNEIASGCGK